MEEKPTKPSRLGEMARFTAVTSGTELLLLFSGLGISGAAYTSGQHLLLLLLVLPIALYLARDWIAGRLKDPD